MPIRYQRIIYWSAINQTFLVEIPELPGCNSTLVLQGGNRHTITTPRHPVTPAPTMVCELTPQSTSHWISVKSAALNEFEIRLTQLYRNIQQEGIVL